MKKIISLILCFMVLLSCATCLSGCGGEEVAMFTGKEANFLLIRPQEADREQIATANYFRQAIIDTHEITPTYKQDNVKVKEGQLEVNVGVTNRPRAKEIYEDIVNARKNHALDYTILFEDNIIYIVGGSNTALQNAVEFFLSHFCGYTTSTIKRGFEYKYLYSADNNFSIGGEKDMSGYKIVTPQYNLSYLVGKEADNLKETLFLVTGNKVERVDDNKKETDKEIVIGPAKRSGTPLPFNTDEYIIRVDKKKVYINGGSDVAAAMGVKQFITMLEEGKELEDGFEYVGSASYDSKEMDKETLYKLTWSDEFDTLDTKIWNVANGYYNNQSKEGDTRKSVFSNQEKHVNTKGGYLNMKAELTDTTYVGVEMRTERSVWYKYGLIEISGKFNCSRGICAAFWTLGNSNQEVHAEYDAFECLGMPGKIKATPISHTKGEAATKLGGSDVYYCGSIPKENKYEKSFFELPKGETFDDEFHTIGLDWDETSLRWVYDGKVFFEVDTTVNERAQRTFNGLMQIILTLYSGNNVAGLTGWPDETTGWENNNFTVDYVRLYQLPSHTLTLN